MADWIFERAESVFDTHMRFDFRATGGKPSDVPMTLHLPIENAKEMLAAARAALGQAARPSERGDRLAEAIRSARQAAADGSGFQTNVSCDQLVLLAAAAERMADLEAALVRLGSSETMTIPFAIPSDNCGDELKARVEFARKAAAQ